MRLFFILTIVLMASNVIGQQQLLVSSIGTGVDAEQLKVLDPLPVPKKTLYPVHIQNEVYAELFSQNEEESEDSSLSNSNE